MGRGRRTACAVLASALLVACGGGDGYGTDPAESTSATEATAGSETANAGEAGAESVSPADDLTQEPLSPDDPASRPTAAAAPSPEGLAGDVFAFSAPAIGGGQVEGGEFVGQDLALWFWAPW